MSRQAAILHEKVSTTKRICIEKTSWDMSVSSYESISCTFVIRARAGFHLHFSKDIAGLDGRW